MEERIYASFFVNGEHFTVEDYDQGVCPVLSTTPTYGECLRGRSL